MPFPILPKVKKEKELQRLEDEYIIEKVSKSTDWCSPIVPTRKQNGEVKLCVDLKKLSSAIKREHFAASQCMRCVKVEK